LRRLIEVETARPATEVDARPRTVDEVADELRDRLNRGHRCSLANRFSPQWVA
jgi:hypothetical protein